MKIHLVIGVYFKGVEVFFEIQEIHTDDLKQVASAYSYLSITKPLSTFSGELHELSRRIENVSIRSFID